MSKVGIRKILWCVQTSSHFYNTSTGLPGDNVARQAFADFVAAVVTRYDASVGSIPVNSVGGPGQGLTHWWEMANEPNLKHNTTAAQYAAMVQQAARAVRALAGGDRVTLVGPALADGGGQKNWDYLRNVTSILEDIDLLSVHLYRPTQPESIYDLRDANLANVSSLRGFIQQNTRRNVDVISGEYGYTTCVNLRPNAYCSNPVSEATQANYIARMWLTALEANLPLANYYDWVDDCDDVTNREVGHGGGAVRFLEAPVGISWTCFFGERHYSTVISFLPPNPLALVASFPRSRPSVALASHTRILPQSPPMLPPKRCCRRWETRHLTGLIRAPRTTRAL
jgi:hypothetical protein